MTSSFRPADITNSNKEQINSELEKQGTMEKELAEKKQLEAELRAKQEAAEAESPEGKKRIERAEVRGRFISKLVDWQIEDLNAKQASSSINATVINGDIAVQFVVYEKAHDLTGEMRRVFIESLTNRLRKEGWNVKTDPETDCNPCADSMSELNERFVGLRFTLTCPVKSI